jgi:hypothetical protein
VADSVDMAASGSETPASLGFPGGLGRRPLGRSFWALAIVLGLVQVWAHRHDVGPDGTSYIEIAQAAQHTGWHGLVNGYWSPLYPFLLSWVFRAFHPGLYWESTAVHFLNLAIYLAALYCFEVFLRELLVARSGSNSYRLERANLRQFWIWGYLLFLWACRFWISPAEVTPDLCVASLVFLATAALLRIRRRAGGWTIFAALGAVLGLSYLAKAAMFPLAFAFMLSAFLLAGPWQQAAPRTLLALAAFAAVAAPFVFALSKSKNRPTFGDVGRISYAEYIDGAPKFRHWQGEPPGTGVPIHPTRRVSVGLPFYEFSGPIPGSYPPWYDPSYWYEGITPRVSVKGQLMALYRTASSYLRIFSTHGTLYLVSLGLFLLRRSSPGLRNQGHRFLIVCLPAYATLILYALVHVEPRFVGGVGLMLLAVAFTSVDVSEISASRTRRLAGFLIIVAPALAMALGVIGDAQHMFATSFEQYNLARELHKSGIAPSSRLGTIGMGLDAYWAHLAGIRIIAEISEGDEIGLLNADGTTRQAILAKFSEVGARAIVTNRPAVANSMGAWQQLGSTHFYIYRLKSEVSQP